MIVISVVMTLRIPQARSIKSKRSVVRSLVQRLQQRFNVTAAEVEFQENQQLARVGFAVVSGSASTARQVAQQAFHFAESTLIGRAEIIDLFRDEQVVAR